MDAKIEAIIKSLTLEEKAALCSGMDFWTTKPIRSKGVPSVFVSDGPHGLRKENNEDVSVGMKMSYPATAFPTAATLASSWDVSLSNEMGQQLGEECLDQNVNMILGPGTNIKRSPLCGRNFEYFSEDPFLSGKMSRSFIDGVQSKGVGTSLKHFCANNQEKLRQTMNSIVDERALREIYLAPFEEGVKAQPYSIMCSYNLLNGTYLSDDKKLLSDILRDEFGFKGIVVSDWNATNDRVAGIEAGLDLEMPSSGGANDKLIVKAVKNEVIKEETLDIVVSRILEFIFKCKAGEQEFFKADYHKSHELSRKIAEQCMVLLKNEGNILPLAEGAEELTVIGSLAKKARYQGTGSSRINPRTLVSFTDCLDAKGIKYTYESAYNETGDNVNVELLKRAIETAKSSKTCILFAGLTDDFEMEGRDRDHMHLPLGQQKLIQEVCRINPKTIIILSGGAPICMPWINETNCILNSYLCGEACGEAVYNVVFGKVNPSGKLAETYPIANEDNLSSHYFPMGPKHVEYRESIYVGYRYFDTAKKDVLFPFGYGLSYTTFEYSDLKINGLQVTYKITNTGKYGGAEVSQLYVKDCAPVVFKAEKELKDFAKTYLAPGHTKTVTHTLDYRSFAFYNTATSSWYASNGEYEICIGASSRDIRLSQTIDVTLSQEKQAVVDYKSICPVYYNLDKESIVPLEQFTSLYGAEVPQNKPLVRGQLDRTATMQDLSCCLIGKIILKVAPFFIKKTVKVPDITTMMMLELGMKELPVRALCGITTGLVSYKLVDGLLLSANKHRLKGLVFLISGLVASLNNLVYKNRRDKVFLEDLKEKKKKEEIARKEQKEKDDLAKKELKEKEDLARKEQKEKDDLAKKELKEEIKSQKLEEKQQKLEEKIELKQAKLDDTSDGSKPIEKE